MVCSKLMLKYNPESTLNHGNNAESLHGLASQTSVISIIFYTDSQMYATPQVYDMIFLSSGLELVLQKATLSNWSCFLTYWARLQFLINGLTPWVQVQNNFNDKYTKTVITSHTKVLFCFI